MDNEFPKVLNRYWVDGDIWHLNIQRTVTELQAWNKNSFGNVFKEKRKLMSRIQGIQQYDQYGRNLFLDKLERELKQQMETILDREEVIWIRKSCKDWNRDGDRNTRYYHAKTITRRRKNKVLKLRDSEGNWKHDQVAIYFYENSFIEIEENKEYLPIHFSYPTLNEEELAA